MFQPPPLLVIARPIGILIAFWWMIAGGENLPVPEAAGRPGVDLLRRYPTTLVAGDAAPAHARSWDFSGADVFQLTRVSFSVGRNWRVKTGPADLGIGHCADGVVWAVIIPRETGTLVTEAYGEEPIARIWLRFHPARINQVFPPDTVIDAGSTNLVPEMRQIATIKMSASWQAAGKALIPEPWFMAADVDTRTGQRRFFSINTQRQTAEPLAPRTNAPVHSLEPINPETARAAFDRLWETFDRDYAMFVLRPEVDWSKLRDRYRPQAIAAASTLEFAEICSRMLKELRDTHVWFMLDGDYISAFDSPQKPNANPAAYPVVLGADLQPAEPSVQWAVTSNRIGFIAIHGWNDPAVPDRCQEALEQMRNTRGLIVDVRANPGGSEDQAMAFACRFLEHDFTYAYHQVRNGPAHTNLTGKFPRRLAPYGPWRYDRPVIVLIGPVCASSDESFISMMTGDPLVTTMGERTAGASGNPEAVELAPGLTVHVPQWIDYRPDGTPLDGHGIEPQIPFRAGPDAFVGHRDDLLTAALDRLSRVPLPEKPIRGPVFTTAEQPEPPETSLPLVSEADANRFLGTWETKLAGGQGPASLAIKIAGTNGAYQAALVMPDPGATNLPFTKCVFTGKTSLLLELSAGDTRAVFRATLNTNATELSGIWMEGRAPAPITFKRITP